MKLGALLCLAQTSGLARRFPFKQLLDRARKVVRTRRSKRQRAQRLAAIEQHGLVAPQELLAVLRDAGIAEGDLVFVQTSFNDLSTFDGNALRLLGLLRELVGPAGTLLMPAFCAGPVAGSPEVFDPARSPTNTGIVNELFRRSDEVQRSLHPRHSICGAGPLAEALLQGHEDCAYADGAGSPFDRMRQVPRAKLLTLGLPRGCISYLHWVEDIDPGKFPWRVHVAQPALHAVRLPDGRQIQVSDRLRREFVACRLDFERVAARLSPAAMRQFQHRGIQLGIYAFAELTAELLALRDAGVVHYS